MTATPNGGAINEGIAGISLCPAMLSRCVSEPGRSIYDQTTLIQTLDSDWRTRASALYRCIYRVCFGRLTDVSNYSVFLPSAFNCSLFDWSCIWHSSDI